MNRSFPALFSRTNKDGADIINASFEAGGRRYWFTGEGHCGEQMRAKRADELQAEREKRADEIQIAQIEAAKEKAKLEAEKELKIKQMELQAQQAQAQVTASSATTPPPRNKDAKSPKLPCFIDEKDELDSYLLRLQCYAENASWEKDTWAIKLSALLTGRARMSDADASNYDKLKKALLTRYNYTEDGYRKDSEKLHHKLKKHQTSSSIG